MHSLPLELDQAALVTITRYSELFIASIVRSLAADLYCSRRSLTHQGMCQKIAEIPSSENNFGSTPGNRLQYYTLLEKNSFHIQLSCAKSDLRARITLPDYAEKGIIAMTG